jgi:RNA polymerase sigma factor (sigma-70 family)
MALTRNGSQSSYLRGLFEHGVTSALTDGQLLERFASRSGESSELAFAALVDRHGAMVFRACQAILQDEHEAMDTFQATFLLLAQKGRSLWVRDSLAPWLHRVACRAATRAKFLAARRQRLACRAAELGAIRDRAADPRSIDFASDLHEEIDRLPERYRSAVVLCELKGYTVDDAARLVKCPVGTLATTRVHSNLSASSGRNARRS